MNHTEHLLAEAREATTPPERLRALASHKSAEVRRTVAANPNTPEEVLLRLAVHFPQEFLANPVLDLLILVNPNLLAEVPPYVRQRLLAHPKAPPGFLKWAATYGDEAALLSLAHNPSTPAELIEPLTRHPLPKVAEAAAMHVSLEASVLPQAILVSAQEADSSELRQLAQLDLLPAWLSLRAAREADSGLRVALAASSSPAELLSALLLDEDEEVRKAARANPATPRESLDWVERLERGEAVDVPLETLALGHGWLRQLVARHPLASQALLAGFAQHQDWKLRQAVAANPRLSTDWLEKLGSDPDRDVRQAVAANPATPVPVLERLVGDENEEVRQAAAANPSAPQYVLQLFERVQAQDTALEPEELERMTALSQWGRRLAVSHPNTPPHTLERYCTDQDWHTRLAVAKNPKALPSTLVALATDTDADVRQAVAAHPSTPMRTLEQLSADDQPDVRLQVAQHPLADPHLLSKLAQDDNWKVRQAVAASVFTPPEILTRLAHDPDRDVRQAVADHPKVPEEALEPLFSGWFAGLEASMSLVELYRRASKLQAVSPQLLLELARGSDWAKRLAAPHPDTPLEALQALASDQEWRVRQAVAANPSLSPELLLQLSQDSDADVRRAVAANPAASGPALEHLALDEQNETRLLVARHPGVSESLLSILLYDEQDEVRQLALAHPLASKGAAALYARAAALDPGLPPDFLERLAGQTLWSRMLAGQNPSTPPEALARLAQDADWRVRQGVAKNTSAWPELLSALAQDADRDVRTAVAENLGTPVGALLALLGDLDEGVRLLALRHPNLPADYLQGYRTQLLVRASRSRYALCRAAALSSPQLPPPELHKVKHWASPEWAVRYAVATNPGAHPEVLQQLAQDGNRWVKQKALERLQSRLEGQ